MAETNMNAFTTSCAGYVHTYILGPICQHLGTKGIQTTVEELAAVLQLPAVRAPSTPMMPGPAVPSMSFGGAVPSMAPTVAPSASRKSTAIDTPVAGRTCAYQYKRGVSKGKFCPKAPAPGSDFCNTCLKQRKNLHKETSAAPGAAPGMGLPGAAGIPAGYIPPTSAVAGNDMAPSQPGQLSVVEYDASRNLYREPNHNFIVVETSPGVVTVLGRINEIGGELFPLTDQEKVTAEAIGLQVATQNASPAPQNNPPPAYVPPAIPSMPTAIPSMPALPVPTQQLIQAPPAIPTGPVMPVIPSLSGAVMGESLPSIPQIPGIPQIQMS